MPSPCLCGDPYCPWCGNPELAQFEEWMDKHCELLESLDLSKSDCVFIDSILPELIKSFRTGSESLVKEAVSDYLNGKLPLADEANVEGHW